MKRKIKHINDMLIKCDPLTICAFEKVLIRLTRGNAYAEHKG